MTDLVQTVIYQLGLPSADYQRDSKLVVDANAKLVDSFSRLEAKVDKSVAAERKLAQGIVDAARFREEGRISQERYQAQLQRLTDAYGPNAVAAARSAESTVGFGAAITEVRGVLASLGIALGVVQIARLGLDALKSAGDLGELAQQLGIGTKSLQTYQYAAAQAGVSQSELETSIAKFTKTVGDAAGGNKSALDFFNALGVGILDAQGKLRSTDDILLDVADALSKIQDPAKRAALEVDGLGRSGQKTDTIFAQGRQGILEYRTEMEKLGLFLTDEQIAAADAAGDAIDRLKFRFNEMVEKVAAGLAGPLADFLEWGQKLGDNSANEALMARLKHTEDLAEATAQVAILTKQLARDTETINSGNAPLQGPEYLAALQARLDAAKAVLEALQHTGTTGGGRSGASGLVGSSPNIIASNSNPESDEGKAKRLSDAAKAAREAEQAYESYARALATVEDAIDPVQGAVYKLTEAQGLLTIAFLKGEKTGAEFADSLAKLKTYYSESIDPTGKAFEKLEKQQDAQKKRLDAETIALGMTNDQRAIYLAGVEAEIHLMDQKLPIDSERAKAYEETARAIQEASNANARFTRDLQRGRDVLTNFFDQTAGRISGALTDAFATGRIEMAKFGDVGKAVLNELTSLALQLAVINPIKNWIGGPGSSNPTASTLFGSLGTLFNSFTLSGSIDNMIAANPGIFAAGGIMTDRGPVALRRYAGGGVATGPQAALFGEGSQNEAFVPLPDGRSIPVKIEGGMGGGNIQINQTFKISGGGNEQQNSDLAGKVSAQVRNAVRDVMRQEIIEQQRVGGSMRRGVQV